MSALVQIAREPRELRRTGTHAVKENDGSRPALAVEERDGASFVADIGMIALEQPLEPL